MKNKFLQELLRLFGELQSQPPIPSRTGDMLEAFGQLANLPFNSDELLFALPSLIGMPKAFMRSFAEALIAGDANGDRLEAMPAKAKTFLAVPKDANLPASFSIMYGPKIHAQLDNCLLELKADNSRRAILHILTEADRLIIDRPDLAHLEYPCTTCIQFFNRQGILYMHVHMRSQNIRLMEIDAYNFCRLGEHIAGLLELECANTFTMTFGSLHAYCADLSESGRYAQLTQSAPF